MSWIKKLLESTNGLESPQSYFYWSALASISATVAKRIYLNRGGIYRLYPNVYVFLISKKSGLRKGIPVNFAKKVTHEVGTVRVIDGQNSIQGVLKELSSIKTNEGGHIIKSAEGFLITGEFASFMLQDGVGFSLTTLTDLYDTQYHEKGFNKRLATQDELQLKEPCLTALFASNETHFFDAVPKTAMTGGFLARTFCIYESQKQAVNSLMRGSAKFIDYKDINSHLLAISKLKGEFKIEENAIDLYESWYQEFALQEIEGDTGTEERIGDNILKAAMLISLADSPNLIINIGNMEEAIKKSMDSFVGLRRLMMGGVGDAKSIKSTTFKIVMTLLLGAAPSYEVSRKRIMIKGAGVFGPYDLDETVEHFLQAKMISIDKRGSDMHYKLKDWVVKKHLELSTKEDD
jgi:hypothetical protein